MWIYRDQSEADFIREISTLSDRLIGILAPIVLEERLKSAIQHRWVDNAISGGTTILKDLFGPSGEMGSFGTKVRVGFAIGLYGPESYADLVRIGKTRNEFAHKLDVKSFNDRRVVDYVRGLSINGRWPEDRPLPLTLGEHSIIVSEPHEQPDASTLRGKFLGAVGLFSHLLYHESQVRRTDPRTPVF
jgi:hypothetical protein